ncbi:hypothetical protein DAEQUDRAFT_725752 [Daedalea quercina L-15889]|uniref:Uncharacterized protein n=1 Tax=Daedalea quercina L-15889 TaxID=1314783 RepID=A0A165QZV3_9APHY|nr:hypothetical protein DAEQUDRAFT_725752 [Daedalea quercina L-15889]
MERFAFSVNEGDVLRDWNRRSTPGPRPHLPNLPPASSFFLNSLGLSFLVGFVARGEEGAFRPGARWLSSGGVPDESLSKGVSLPGPPEGTG